MGKKGIKSEKGQGEAWEEAKTERLSLKLTPTCKQLLEQTAIAQNTSISEVIEHAARTQNLKTVGRTPPTLAQVVAFIEECSVTEAGRIARVAIARLELESTNSAALTAQAFLQKLTSASVSEAEVIEAADILGLDTSKLNQLVKAAQAERKNGV